MDEEFAWYLKTITPFIYSMENGNSAVKCSLMSAVSNMWVSRIYATRVLFSAPWKENYPS